MQKGIYFTEIHQKYVRSALLNRDLPPHNVKNKFIKIFFEKAMTTHPPVWIKSLNIVFFVCFTTKLRMQLGYRGQNNWHFILILTLNLSSEMQCIQMVHCNLHLLLLKMASTKK